ncbi:hypothetical protein SNOG_08843 [Parastagonospora nodorum SN15]|uniref:Uncharacterized protein n=1 Tax=Phaeosphaeria nodorum (strain SN15 / ATCC MYA-4574 / FGSC 10173) TaxID=321614 RepID=Q0UHC1_PHANO|nr:hypothetical protein SNOG_08843 [Parastagonospora nodorum SN15]EAT84011.1 hypothetical protein SNOG_08843 [Parastagonospora nodorum SN15]
MLWSKGTSRSSKEMLLVLGVGGMKQRQTGKRQDNVT